MKTKFRLKISDILKHKNGKLFNSSKLEQSNFCIGSLAHFEYKISEIIWIWVNFVPVFLKSLYKECHRFGLDLDLSHENCCESHIMPTFVVVDNSISQPKYLVCVCVCIFGRARILDTSAESPGNFLFNNICSEWGFHQVLKIILVHIPQLYQVVN